MKVQIVNFEPKYEDAFRELNYEWINKYFEVETSDQQMLEDPQGYIIGRGGFIFVGLMDGKPVGVCALVKGERWELAKMAVSPVAQGKGLGWHLGKAVIDKAKELGVGTLFLETNSILEPAIRLYKKLGFEEITGCESPYARCNVQMELVMDEPGERECI